MTQSVSDYCLARAREMNDNSVQLYDMVRIIAEEASAKFSTPLTSAHRIAGNAVAEVVSSGISGYIDIEESNAHLITLNIEGHRYGITLLELANYLKARNDFELSR